MISIVKIHHNSRMLDMGCGTGNLLYSLNKMGFKNSVGVDPYIDENIKERNIKILKKTIYDLPNNEKVRFDYF